MKRFQIIVEGDGDGVDIYEIGVQELQEALGVCDI